MSLRDSMMARFAQLQQEQRDRDAAALETARTQPIPGLTGPPQGGANIPGVGMAPPQQQLPPPLPGTAHPSMDSGPYGQQAMQMAGVRPTMFAPGQMPHGTQYLGDADPRLQGMTMDHARQIPMLGAYGPGGLREIMQQRFPDGRGGLLGGMVGRTGNHMVQPTGLLGGKSAYRPGGK
jgi:hypothetical protein